MTTKVVFMYDNSSKMYRRRFEKKDVAMKYANKLKLDSSIIYVRLYHQLEPYNWQKIKIKG